MSATSTSSRYTALVLAGERPGGTEPVAAATGVRYKCLAPAAGTPMLVRVVGALAASRSIDRILVSLGDTALLDELPALAELRKGGRLEAVKSAETPSLSVAAMADGAELPLLVTTADHALLTPDMVDHFCARPELEQLDVAAGIVPIDLVEARYPRTRRTVLKFRDGGFSGANLFAITSAAGRGAIGFWRRVEQDRKRPWRIAQTFGLISLLLYVAGRLTLDAAGARMSRVMGARVGLVSLPFGEAAIDVDRPADLDVVNAILGAREGAVSG